MRERLIIVFIAVGIGLIVTTLVFFLYQQTKSLPQNITQSQKHNTDPENKESEVYLQIDEPTDESLSDRRTISVKGKTDIENIIVASTNQEDVVAKPTNDGDFSISIDIDSGTNKVVIRAITPNGDTKEEIRVITFNTEDF